MKEKLIELKAAIAKQSANVSALKGLREDFEAENRELIQAVEAGKKKVAALKDELRPMALARFEVTGAKKLEGGLGIREKSKLEYDKDKALAWAKEKDLCLALDVKAFEAGAAGFALDFVEVVKVASVTFPAEVKADE